MHIAHEIASTCSASRCLFALEFMKKRAQHCNSYFGAQSHVCVLFPGEGCIIVLYHCLIPAIQEACIHPISKANPVQIGAVPKPFVQSKRARYLRLGDFDLGFDPAFHTLLKTVSLRFSDSKSETQPDVMS